MKKFFLFTLVATMFAACVTDETQDVAVELVPDTLTVSFEDADSRIQLQNGKTVWTKGDLVSVFYRQMLIKSGSIRAKRASARALLSEYRLLNTLKKHRR